jgi:hypothetical protein
VVNSSKISDLESLTKRIDTLSNIIRLSSIVIESNIPSNTLAATKSASLDIKTASLQVLSDYTRLPQSKIIEIITNPSMIGEKLWDQYVNENKVTEEILNNYYN